MSTNVNNMLQTYTLFFKILIPSKIKMVENIKKVTKWTKKIKENAQTFSFISSETRD